MSLFVPVLFVGAGAYYFSETFRHKINSWTYYFSENFRNRVHSWANYGLDMYLDYKYQNYDPIEDLELDNTETPYLLNKIQYITHDLNHECFNIPFRELFDDYNHDDPIDLRNATANITYDRVKQALVKRLSESAQLSLDYIVVYVYYSYGEHEYIVPVKIDQEEQSSVIFPIYDADDVESCMKTEYSSIAVGDRRTDSDHQFQNTMNHYAGPKGNFYSDHDQINVYPKWIRCHLTHKKIVDNPDQQVEITTIFDEVHYFGYDDPINVDDLILIF